MNEGDIALTSLPQADGQIKNRAVMLLKRMPGFGDWLDCGISTQLQQQVAGFDELISAEHRDYPSSGLKAPSLIRLGFLAVVPLDRLPGILGAVSRERHRRLLDNLANYLKV